jgi:hypothetical protein
MHQQNNTNNALASARTSHSRDLNSRTLHPYTRALSRDALLDEIDDRLYAGSELEEVEELFSLREQGHGLTPGSA